MRVMLGMITASHHSQILRRIIRRVPINVMHHLVIL
jgi:hypothetical protein